jgi:hypothetical membrane protein
MWIWSFALLFNAGRIDSISDILKLIIKKNGYISILLVFLGTIGIFSKRKISWIISALIFYIMTMALLLILSRFNYNIYEIITYIPVISIFLFIDYTLNSESVLNYYNIDLSKTNRLKINIAPLLISIGISLFLFFSNYI